MDLPFLEFVLAKQNVRPNRRLRFLEASPVRYTLWTSESLYPSRTSLHAELMPFVCHLTRMSNQCVTDPRGVRPATPILAQIKSSYLGIEIDSDAVSQRRRNNSSWVVSDPIADEHASGNDPEKTNHG